jgi:hypothetical protein
MMKKPCPSGKRKFLTSASAEARIAGIAGVIGQPLYAYECRLCGFFHLTRSSPKRGKLGGCLKSNKPQNPNAFR